MTVDAIVDGLYEGVITYGDLKEYGDLGLGTFEGLDGGRKRHNVY